MTANKKPTVPYSTAFGEYLRKVREAAGYSQSELAQALGMSSPQMVSNWERGICGPSFSNLMVIAKLCKIGKTNLLKKVLDAQKDLFKKHLAAEAI